MAPMQLPPTKAESKPASPEAGTPQLEGDFERPEKIPARELITTIYDTSHPSADLRREISPCGTHVQLGASWVKTNGQLALMDIDPMLVRAGLPQTQLPELLPLGASSLTSSAHCTRALRRFAVAAEPSAAEPSAAAQRIGGWFNMHASDAARIGVHYHEAPA